MTGAIGTGPWKVTSYQAGQQAEFAANTNYWGTGPYADQLTMIEFADPTAKLNALIGGTVDHVTLLASAQASVVNGNPAMQLLQAKSGSWDPFTMRIDQKPFDDVRVRQAFRLIVDREQMIQQAKGGYAWQGNDMYAPYDPGYPKDVAPRNADVAQAKSLLKQAGYSGGLTVQLDDVDRGRRRRRRRGPGVRAAGQGGRRHGQDQPGRPEPLLRHQLPQVDVRAGLLGDAQLPGPGSRTAPLPPRRTTSATGRTRSGRRSSTRPSRRSTRPSATSSSPRPRRSSSTAAATSSGRSTTRSTPTARNCRVSWPIPGGPTRPAGAATT